MKTAVALFALTAIVLTGLCSAKNCYSCNYSKKGSNLYENFLIDYKKDCGDPFKKDNITTEDCDNDCYKAVVDVPGKNLECISRGCFPTKKCSATDKGKEFVLECAGKAYETTLHCCSGSECNAGPVHRLSAAAIIAVLVMAVASFA